MKVRTKRIYEPPAKDDGYRVLVDRLWPRGIQKETAHLDEWLKEVGPSTELRKWFNHDPDNWRSFLTKYRTELKKSPAFKELMTITREHPVVTLLYSAKNEEFNQAMALQQFINKGGL